MRGDPGLDNGVAVKTKFPQGALHARRPWTSLDNGVAVKSQLFLVTKH